MSVDDNTIAFSFLVSFIVLLLGTSRNKRFASWGIPIFGLGWLIVFVWLGILQ